MRSRFYQRFYEDNKVTPIERIWRELGDRTKDQDQKLSEYRKMRRKFEAKGTADDKKDFNALSERMVKAGLGKFRADLEDLEQGEEDATQQMEERLEKLSEVQRSTRSTRLSDALAEGLDKLKKHSEAKRRAVSRAIAGRRTSSRLSQKPRRTLSSSRSSEARRSSRDARRTVPSSRKSSEASRSSRDARRTVPSSRKSSEARRSSSDARTPSRSSSRTKSLSEKKERAVRRERRSRLPSESSTRRSSSRSSSRSSARYLSRGI